uniref:tRNA (guanine-N(7)-)-methyltransferase n=1 Tax=Dermatophagoides pteronyssinus TaxID=6956 RepID=A0A6P6XKV0_DERPT|nr:tRNA (guanine-N(7)-)-methyltransferase-like [Dermatophagoides pteronyssinus]
MPFPKNPNYVNWNLHFPGFFGPMPSKEDLYKLHINTREHPIEYETEESPEASGINRPIDFLDMGCGFGALVYELGRLYPDKLTLGIEIREKPSTFVAKKILAFRHESNFQQYRNCSVIRTNGMKYLLNYIRQHTLSAMFILFPDPHFKKSNWKRRIISDELLTKYEFVLKENGNIYYITDVYETFTDAVEKFERHPGFVKVSDEETQNDAFYKLLFNVTDECKKAIRLDQTLHSVVILAIELAASK